MSTFLSTSMCTHEHSSSKLCTFSPQNVYYAYIHKNVPCYSTKLWIPVYTKIVDIYLHKNVDIYIHKIVYFCAHFCVFFVHIFVYY